ncbi:unnamed protein product [Soboliphyme baturini]|uniref:Uncharacterized protein n=1 Tax=Soboliphyme baturini TaxID=241478 RepID=A0A183IDL4_9BILA|nr:unnamed protein product [Soboliphyme baturini]
MRWPARLRQSGSQRQRQFAQLGHWEKPHSQHSRRDATTLTFRSVVIASLTVSPWWYTDRPQDKQAKESFIAERRGETRRGQVRFT